MPPFRSAAAAGVFGAAAFGASSGVTQTVTYKGIPVGLEYRAVKALRLTVYPDCRVLAVIPRHTPPEVVYAFVDAKLPWIKKHLALYQEKARKKPLAANRFVDGEIHYVWGVPFGLEVRERRGHPRIEAAVPAEPAASAELPALITAAGSSGDSVGTGGVLRMYVRPGAAAAQKQALLDKWRKQLVAEAAPALAAK
jgi:predicted metal-dependent hydrolase